MEKENGKRVYYPDGGYGWVVVSAIILINVSLQTLLPCFGLIFRDEFKEWNVTSAQTSFLLHLQNSLYCLFGFLTSPFLKKYGMRYVACTGALFMCSGFLLTSFATSYLYLVFSVSVLMGVGQGIIMPATYFATYTYFKKKLTIATSLTVTSASLSSIVMPKICDFLLGRIGRRNTILILFLVSLLSIVGSVLLKPVKRKDDGEAEEDKPLEGTGKEDGKLVDTNGVLTEELLPPEIPASVPIQTLNEKDPQKSTVWTKFLDIFDLHLVKDIPFVLIVIGLGISFAAELNIILMLQFILRDLCLFERSDVATAVTIQSVADIMGRLVVPLLSHYFQAPEKFMYASALIVASFGRTILSVWPEEHILVLAVVVLVGLTKGTRAVFQSVILPKYVPLTKIPAANGLNMLFTGSVSLIIGPLIGLIHDKSGTYVNTLHAATVLSLCCVVLWIFESLFFARRSDEPEGNPRK